MNNESGNTKVKAVLIAVIILLIVGLVAVLVLFKTGALKGNNSTADGENNAQIGNADTMTFIEKKDGNYVFIDSNGNVRKISESCGNIDISEGSCAYKNCILVSKDGKQSLIDFNGKTIYGPASLKRIISNSKKCIYQLYEGGKYGVIDETGSVLVPATSSNYFNEISTENSSGYTNSYFYGHETSSTGGGYDVTIYDLEGKVVYKFLSKEASLYGEKCYSNQNGVTLLTIRTDSNTKSVVNLKTGDIIETINDTDKYSVDLAGEGSSTRIRVQDYGSYYKNTYYWFGEDGKVSKKVELAENASFKTSGASIQKAFSIMNKANGEHVAINKYGKEVYTSTKSLSQIECANGITGKSTAYIVENVDRKKYQMINEDGKVVFNDGASYVGNKYVLIGSSLYKHDGTKYMDDVKAYVSVYNLDIIKTQDKIIIENQNGKSVEKGVDFKIGKNQKLLGDNIVIMENEKKVTLVNMDDLSMKELDFSDAEYIFYEDGYITVVNKNTKTYEYYNKSGNKIYERKR